MKLLLDEQISGKVAEALRELKHDVIAVAEEPTLRGLRDRELFELAQGDRRALATFNVVDFVPIAREFAQTERPHHGLVLINSRRFRNQDFGRLIAAVGALLASVPHNESFLVWLQPPA